jgi:hypothetical protein
MPFRFHAQQVASFVTFTASRNTTIADWNGEHNRLTKLL